MIQRQISLNELVSQLSNVDDSRAYNEINQSTFLMEHIQNFEGVQSKEKCNLTVDQSYASIKNEPYVMHENLKLLKQTNSPIREKSQKMTQKSMQDQPNQQLKRVYDYQQLNGGKQERHIPINTTGQSSIKEELQSSKNNSKNCYYQQNPKQNQIFQDQFASNQDQQYSNKYIIQSVLNEDEFNNSGNELEQELITMLRKNSAQNTKQQLEQRFSKALRKYIKKEIHGALLKTQKISKPAGISDLTLDSIFCKQQTKDKFSCSSSLNYNQDNSIEEEILREISSNLANKMDGLKVLFNEMESKLNFMELKNAQNRYPQQVNFTQSLRIQHPQLQDQHQQQQQFFSNTTDQEAYCMNIKDEKAFMSQASSKQVVNASDLDQWVKRADEYRDLYLKADNSNQIQQGKYEEIIKEQQQLIQSLNQQLTLKYCQDCQVLSQIINYVDNQEMLNRILTNIGQLQIADQRRQNWEFIIREIQKTSSLQYQVNEYQLQIRELQFNLEQSKIGKKVNSSSSQSSDQSMRSHRGQQQQINASNDSLGNYENKMRLLESELRILKEEKETQELEIRHLKLVNHSNNSQRSLHSNVSKQHLNQN